MRYLGIQYSFSLSAVSPTLSPLLFDAIVRHLALVGTFRITGRTSPHRLEVLVTPHLSVPLSRELVASVAERIATAIGPLVPRGLESAAISPCADEAGVGSSDCYTLVPTLKAKLSPVVAETGDDEWPGVVARIERGEACPELLVAESQPEMSHGAYARTALRRAAAE